LGPAGPRWCGPCEVEKRNDAGSAKIDLAKDKKAVLNVNAKVSLT